MDEKIHEQSMDPALNKTDIYNKWSNTYEDYVKDLKYYGPTNLSLKLKEFITDKSDINILDFGCGTGLVGLELYKLLNEDYNLNIDGLDISENMIQKCRQKNIYNHIWNLDLTQKSLPDNYQYDFIVSSGVFLEGHVRFSIIENLLNSLKPQNYLVFTTRITFLNNNFTDFYKHVTKNKRCNMVYCEDIDYLKNVKCKLIILYKIF
jgi:predicted TPR repeat methyltransferase